MQANSSTAFLLLAATLAGCSTTSIPDVEPITASPREPVFQNPSTTTTTATSPTGRPMTQAELHRRTTPWEVTVGGAGSSNKEFDAGGGQGSFSVGYFVNDIVELSARQNLAYADGTPDGGGAWNGASRAALDLHIPLGNVLPYVGANVGYVYGDSIHDSIVAGPEAGVKIFLKDEAFVQFAAEWEFFLDKDETIGAAFDDGQLLYALSMGLRF